LGVVLYEMLSGTPPFNAPTAEELARLHIEAEPIPINQYVPDVPATLEEIVMKVLSKEPAARYRTADQLGRVLLKFGTRRDDDPTVAALAMTPHPMPLQPTEATLPPPPLTPAMASRTGPQPAAPDSDIDWVTVGLGLLALLALGGLVPFWMWIYFSYNPPIR
jgi:serine/threonine-protein kinase